MLAAVERGANRYLTCLTAEASLALALIRSTRAVGVGDATYAIIARVTSQQINGLDVVAVQRG